MQVFISLIVSALMVLGSFVYVEDVKKETARIEAQTIILQEQINDLRAENLGANQRISELTAMTSIDDADTIPVVDNSGTPTTKKITWANATSSLQTWYDGRYQTILTNSAGLRSALSDETGTGLAVFATTPTLTTPILNSATITTPYLNVAGTEAAGNILYFTDNGGSLGQITTGAEGTILQMSSGLPTFSSLSGLLLTSSSTLTATTTFTGNVIGVTEFGGDGTDGALSISSGTTTITMNGSTAFTKNYSSISITGTGALTFTGANPGGTVVTLRSSGDCTITSSAGSGAINVFGIGAAGGAQAAANANGNAGSDSEWILDTLNHYGDKGTGGAVGATAGIAGVAFTQGIGMYASSSSIQWRKSIYVVPGSGGGSGGGGESNGSGTGGVGGAGGAGGGALILECAGYYNFTGKINASGANGSNGGNQQVANSGGGAGGGGGSGGMIVVLYNWLTADSGTYSVAGGTGGSGGTGATYAGGDGGGGGSILKYTGTDGVLNSGSTGGTGGNGSVGQAFSMKNNVF